MSALPLKADITMWLDRLNAKLWPPKLAIGENAPEVPLLGQRLTSVCSLQAEPPLTSGTFPGLSKEIWRTSTESEKTRDWVAVLAVRREPVSPCKLGK